MSKKDYESIVIIDDDDDITQNNNNIENTENNNNNNNTDTDNIQLVEPKKRTRTKQLPLKKSLLNNEDIKFLKFRDILYELFINNMSVPHCIWYILDI